MSRMPRDIEDLLGRMPLRRAPASLDAKVMAGRWRRRQVLAWSVAAGAMAVAAAVLIAVALPGVGPYLAARDPAPPTPESPARDVAKTESAPVRLERNWATVSYEGVVVPDNQTPLMQFRRHTIGHVQWIDEARHTRMELTIPREDIILVKAPVY